MRRRMAVVVAAVAMVCLLAIGAGWAYWGTSTVAGSNGSSAAGTVNQGATPTVSAAGGAVTVSWAARSLTSGQAVSGYLVKRYNSSDVAQTITSACAGTVTALTCVESAVPAGVWTYTVTPAFATNWRGVESAKSAGVSVDSVAPVNAVTLSGVSGGAFLNSGTGTIYYRGVAAGSFTLTNAVADAISGPASSTTAALTGTTTGWSHTPSTVSTPAGGPYVSTGFTWTAGTTSSPGEVVTGRDVSGNTATTPFTFTNDSTDPVGGGTDYVDGYTSGNSITVTFSSSTDAGSGINSAATRLRRSVAPLVDGVCGTYVVNNNYVVTPTSPYVDTNVQSGACYTYAYVESDNVGNTRINAAGAKVAKVDYAGTVASTTGILSHWRLGEPATTSISADSFSSGAGGALITARTGETGASWTGFGDNTTSAVTFTWSTTAGGQAIRRSDVTGVAGYYTSAAPSSADYRVEADVVVKSLLAAEATGVIGRVDTSSSSGTFFLARYTVATGSWELYSVLNGAATAIGTPFAQTLVAGRFYHLGLDMSGTTISLLVDGVTRVTATSAALPGAGRGGVRFGNGTNAGSASTGIHLDNFQIIPAGYPRAVDSIGSNTGDYHNYPTLGVPGAVGGSNTAAQFNGVNSVMRTPVPVGLPVGASTRSVELWFKTTGTGRRVFFTYGDRFVVGGEFGLWLNTNGTSITAWGVGTGMDQSFTISPAVNDGAWHHLVQTYNGTALELFIDGTSRGTRTVSRATSIDQYGFSIGGVLAPGDAATGGWFNGSLDEVSFYSTALSQTDVTNHYQLGTGPAADFAGPTGGSVDALGLGGTGGRYSTSTTLNIGLSPGTDPSGLAAGRRLTRSTATLTSTNGANGACGTFGSYVTVGTDPVSPTLDTVPDQACYRYQYYVEDLNQNPTTYQSGDIMVDATAPAAPTLAFSSFTNTYWSGTGSTVYYRADQTSGSFLATATGSDPASGNASYSYPALGTNWTSTPGSLGVNTYSWTAAPAAPGTKTVTTTNNAGLTSATAPFTPTADDTGPTTGTVTYLNGSTATATTTVSVSFTTGTDSGSGIGTRLLQRASAPRTSGACGTYTSFSTIVNGTNPTSPVLDTLALGFCYTYHYLVADQVGNTGTAATSTNVVYAASTGAFWSFDSGTTAADLTGNGNTLTLQPGAAYATPGRIGGRALLLNGATNSWASTPQPAVDTSESYSVTAWVGLTTLTGHQSFVSMDGTFNTPFYFQKRDDNYVSFAVTSADVNGFAEKRIVSNATITSGMWYHLVGVYNKPAGTVQLYVNGVLQGTVTGAPASWKATGPTIVGRSQWRGAPENYTDGQIDEVRLYDRVLTQTEVTTLANP